MTSLDLSNFYPTHSTLCVEVITCLDCHSIHRIPAPQLMLRLRHRYARHITILRLRSLLVEYLDIPPGLVQEVLEIHSKATHCQNCFKADKTQLPLFPEEPRPIFIPQPFNVPRVEKLNAKTSIIPATLDEL